MNHLLEKIRQLISGSAKDEIDKGTKFYFCGDRLNADDVADTLLGTLLLRTEQLMSLTSFDDQLGLEIDVQSQPSPVLPIRVTEDPSATPAAFHVVAPFVIHAWKTEVLDHAAALEQFYAQTMRVIDPGFEFESGTSIKPPTPENFAPQPE